MIVCTQNATTGALCFHACLNCLTVLHIPYIRSCPNEDDLNLYIKVTTKNDTCMIFVRFSTFKIYPCKP